MSGPVPVPPINGSLGLAGTLIPPGPGIGSMDVGVAGDTHGNVCVYYTMCGGIGMNFPGGKIGLSTSIGAGSVCSGEQSSDGMYWMGGAGFLGEGQVMINSDGSGTSNTRGVVGVGVGVGADAGAGVLSCTTKMMCLK